MWLEIKTWSYLELSSFTKCAKFFKFFSPQLIPMSSLLNCEPFVLKTCSCANMPCVLTCPPAMQAYMLTYQVPCVLTCLHANVSCVLMCLRANAPCVLTCLRVFHAHVLMCQRVLRAYALTCQRALSPLPHMTCVTMWSPANMLCLLSK